MNQKQLAYKKLMADKSTDAPLCLCGCGNKVKWSIRTSSYNRFLFNHQLKDLSGNWNERIEQIVRGTAIADGYLDARKGRKKKETGLARLAIRHSPKRQLEYIRWKHKELSSITTSNIRIRTTPNAYGDQIAEFSTVSLPQIYSIRQELYIDGVKTVTREYLNKLTDLSFSVWWGDNGSNNSLSTHAFTIEENEIILGWIYEKYNLTPKISIDKRVNLPFIYCNKESMVEISKIIQPHLEKSLWYKIQHHLQA